MVMKGGLTECSNALHHSCLAAKYVNRQFFHVELSLALPRIQKPTTCLNVLPALMAILGRPVHPDLLTRR